MIFDYYHEDIERNNIEGNSYVYNGHDSVLWVNFSKAFSKEIKDTYASWRQDGLLTYDKVVENFITNHSDKWSISIYNEDAEYKYISMYREKGDPQNLYQVKGTGEEHLKYFIKNRLMYCDSKWTTGDFTDRANSIVLRLNRPEGMVYTPSTTLKYTTFSNMYAAVGFGSKSTISASKYTSKGAEVSFSLEGQSTKDLDTYIFGADQVSSLLDLSLNYCGSINVSAATKLTELIVGNNSVGYENTSLKELILTNNRLLKVLNICNCKALDKVIDLSLCPDIEEVYASGSAITAVSLPSAGFLKKISLPSTIATLTITNQKRLQEFVCDSCENVTYLTIENSYYEASAQKKFPLQGILDTCRKDMLVSVSIKNINWDVDLEKSLNNIINKFLDNNGNVRAGFVLEGSVYLPDGVALSVESKRQIHAKFPKLNVIDADPKFFVDYLDYYQGIHYTELVDAHGTALGPPTNPGNINDPNNRYQYVFEGWNQFPTNVTENIQVSAKWQTKYAVTFYNYDGSIIGDPLWYNANEKPKDPIETGDMERPVRDSGTDDFRYVFDKWEGLPNIITQPVEVNATFIKQFPVKFYKTSREDRTQTQHGETVWVNEGDDATPPQSNPTKASTAQYSYTFSGWDGDYTNVHEKRDVYAKYTSTTRKYTVYFYNGDTDTPLCTVKNVSYGNTATYSGEDPVKQTTGSDIYNSSDYEWTGKWSPEPKPIEGTITNIKGEEAVRCYPIFKFVSTLNYTWDQIANDVNTLPEDELFKRYPLGARKNIEFTLTNCCKYCRMPIGSTSHTMDENCPSKGDRISASDITDITYNAVVEIIGHNHDNLADGSGKAKLTFFTNELPNLSLKFGTTERVGWGGSALRTFLQNDVFNNLTGSSSTDGNLQAAIKPILKKYNNGFDPKTNIVESEDTCWVASDAELNLLVDKANSSVLFPHFVQGQGEPYIDKSTNNAVFAGEQARKRFICGTPSTSTVQWWTRSIYEPTQDMGAENMAWIVLSSGSCQGASSINDKKCIAFGFCI